MAYHYAETSAPNGAPLILTFHGTGGDEHQFHDLARQIRPDAHVISPRGDVQEYGANRFFRRTAEGVYDMPDLAQRTQAMATFIALQKARTGAQRVLAFGYSNGANILASVMLDQPDLIDAAAWLHPLIPWHPDPQPGLQDKSVLITAGRHDPICPAPRTEQLAQYMTAQSANLRLMWHPGGHELQQSEITALADTLQAA